ncbi:hypothetical protein N0V83_001024 [Neocucurbitaria cava]|uniref:Uncharacterized protein n=1 Tax=Neocucurbitaria cava TaxID=798079 RepID=A0A9W8YHH4_9PLEO|nr:hypothetical protein N0V83_001024 [Neocucurbitaria cava]
MAVKSDLQPLYQDFQDALASKPQDEGKKVAWLRDPMSLTSKERASFERAFAKGSWLLQLMLSNDHQAGLMFKTPQASDESAFLSSSDLDKWGWRGARNTAFTENWKLISRSVCHVLRVTGLYSTSVDRDNDDHEKSVVDHHYEIGQSIEDTWYSWARALFVQYIDADAGIIVALNNESPSETAHHCGLQGVPSPDLRFWSDVAYLQWSLRASDTSDLKYVLRHNVVNEFTRSILNIITLKNQILIEEWPGRTYDVTSEEGQTLLGTPNGSGVAFLLIQHKKQLGHKAVGKITVFRVGWENMLLFHIKNVE